MGNNLSEVEEQASAIPSEESVGVAIMCGDEPDGTGDAEVSQLWLAEAEGRYEAYLNGELDAFPGDEVMARAHNRLK